MDLVYKLGHRLPQGFVPGQRVQKAKLSLILISFSFISNFYQQDNNVIANHINNL